MKKLLMILRSFAKLVGLSQKPAVTGLWLNGSPNSFISQGMQAHLQEGDGWFVRVALCGKRRNHIQVRFESTEGGYWGVEFAAAGYHEFLKAGEYKNAERYPFNKPGHPGLCFSCHGRGNNRLTGEFTVREIVVLDGKVQSFAADFIQYDEGFMTGWTRGCVRVNSTVVVNPNFLASREVA